MDANAKGSQGEEYVNEISYTSYLKFWCYPGPKDEKGDKKEIADLLILFNDIMIIISVKDYEFKGKYDRYFRATIDKAVSQLCGAERKLLKIKQKLFIKHPDRELEEFDPVRYKSVYRLIVNLGENVKFYPSSSLTKVNDFVHILDKKAFEIIIKELDTIPDLIRYLEERERVFSNKDVLILPGEENDFSQETAAQFLELTSDIDYEVRQSILISGTEYDILATYLTNDKKFPEYFYSKEYSGGWLILDDSWVSFEQREEVIRKRKHDKASYFVDEFVRNEILVNVTDYRIKIAVELLSLNRFDRRVIGQVFFGLYEQCKGQPASKISRRHGRINDMLISFVIYGDKMPAEMVDTCLGVAFEGYSIIDSYKTRKSLMIAANTSLTQFKFAYMDNIAPFPKKHEEDIKHDMSVLGCFTDLNKSLFSIKEYPDK